MKARDIMTADPACCTPRESVERVARVMEQKDCGCVPVVQGAGDNCVIGVVTDRDIAVRGVGHGRGQDTPVREVMTEAPFCCNPDTDVRDVERLMADRQVRRVVVVDDGGCCVGIIAQADLARAAERDAEVTDAEVGRVVERISEPPGWRDVRL